MINNSMKLEFLSISENERFARSSVAAFVSQLNPTLDEIEDMDRENVPLNSLVREFVGGSNYVY